MKLFSRIVTTIYTTSISHFLKSLSQYCQDIFIFADLVGTQLFNGHNLNFPCLLCYVEPVSLRLFLVFPLHVHQIKPYYFSYSHEVFNNLNCQFFLSHTLKISLLKWWFLFHFVYFIKYKS